MTPPYFADFGRAHLAKASLRALVMSTLVLALYYVVPIVQRPHEEIALRLGAALALFGAVVAFELRAIAKHPQPLLRAGVAMATVIPLFLVLFAWIYLTMSRSDPAYFSIHLTRTSALYFAVTIFSTVGFGDIVPRLDVARAVTTVQMIADLLVVVFVVRLIIGAATRSGDKRGPPLPSDGARPDEPATG